MKEKYKCIYSPQVAGYLMMNGMRLKHINKNYDRPWTQVYLFENNDSIDELIDTYKKMKSTEDNKNGIDNKRSGSNT